MHIQYQYGEVITDVSVGQRRWRFVGRLSLFVFRLNIRNG